MKEKVEHLIAQICQRGFLGVEEARSLATQDWLNWSNAIDKDLRSETSTLYHLLRGFVDEVTEGYVEPSNDPYLLARLMKLHERLEDRSKEAGVDPSKWNLINITHDEEALKRLAIQLARNNLLPSGTPTPPLPEE